MKLILDKNFVHQTENFTKDQEKGLIIPGYDLKGNKIEIFDSENDKLVRIVRFLAEGKKKKLGWLLIIGAGILLILFFVLMVWALYPKATPEPKTQIIQPQTQNVTPVAEIKKTETKTDTDTETSWTLELMNEVDMFKDMKDSAEIEALKLGYEVDRLKVELEEKTKTNEKLTTMVNNLENEVNILNTRKSEGATDEFIYYLGESIYKRCEQPTTETAIEKCKTLYFNYLEYAKNR